MAHRYCLCYTVPMKDEQRFEIADLVLAHRFVSPPGWESYEYANGRAMHGLVYVLQGLAHYQFMAGESITLRAGQALLLPRGLPYVTRCEQAVPFEHMTVNFQTRGETTPFVRYSLITPDNRRGFEHLFGTLVKAWAARHPYYRIQCMAMLYQLLFRYLSETDHAPRAHVRKLDPARSYLDEHFMEAFPLAGLAEKCNMTETYFRRLFRAVYQETPSQYRCRLRVAKACDLLLDGRLKVEQIARLCGFEDAAYFSRVFRLAMGCPPVRYQQDGRRRP